MSPSKFHRDAEVYCVCLSIRRFSESGEISFMQFWGTNSTPFRCDRHFLIPNLIIKTLLPRMLLLPDKEFVVLKMLYLNSVQRSHSLFRYTFCIMRGVTVR